MLLEMLIACPMPLRGVTSLPTPPLEGLGRWLLHGQWHRQMATPDVEGGILLARLLDGCRALDPNILITLEGGGLDGLESEASMPPPEDLDELPEGWTQGLCDGRLRAAGVWGDLAFTVTGRLSLRHKPQVPTLTLALRAVYHPLFPAPGLDSDYENELARTLGEPGAFELLEAYLRQEGAALREAFEQALGWEMLPTQGRLLILRESEELEGLLMGFSPEAKRCIFAIGSLYEAKGGAPSDEGVWRRGEDGALWVFRDADGAGEVLHGV